MKVENFKNHNIYINDSNKPTGANSEIKATMKNIDNNINYSDSDEEKNISNQNNWNSYKDESEINKAKKSQSDSSEQNSFDNNHELKSNNSSNINNNINQTKPTYSGYLSDPQLNGYSNFFINNYKEILSVDKHFRSNTTFYSPVSNKNMQINMGILIPNIIISIIMILIKIMQLQLSILQYKQIITELHKMK